MNPDKFSVVSPDDYHSVPLQCVDCLEVIDAGEFTLSELTKLAEEHTPICVPKIWELERCFHVGTEYEKWSSYWEYFTDEERAASYKNNDDTYRFVPRKHWVV